MSLRLEMLQVARLSTKLLGESSALVAEFLRSQCNADGGFADRGGQSDLYYTVFGIEALMALQTEVPTDALAGYLRGFSDGADLDFVHLSCLARCWAALPDDLRGEMPREAIVRRLEQHRCDDGGYHEGGPRPRGTLYGCFLAMGAYQDLGRELPEAAKMVACIESLRTADGGYANQVDMPMGLTPSAAAAATLLRHLGQKADRSLGMWLLARCRPDGGFFATSMAPIPDLLSTATALHALSGLHVDIEPIREPCLDFIDTLWTSRGGFYGSWEDDELDCEYTYYGLLSLGHLSL